MTLERPRSGLAGALASVKSSRRTAPSARYANICSMPAVAQLTLDGADRLHELLCTRRAPVGLSEAAACLFALRSAIGTIETCRT